MIFLKPAVILYFVMKRFTLGGEHISERVFNGKLYYLPLKYFLICKFIYSRGLNAAHSEKYEYNKQEVQEACSVEVDNILKISGKPNASISYW